MGEHRDEQQQDLDDGLAVTEDLDVTDAASTEVRGGAGPNIQDISVTKHVDSSSPNLF
jgi:type VI protein secretion system component Hcp